MHPGTARVPGWWSVASRLAAGPIVWFTDLWVDCSTPEVDFIPGIFSLMEIDPGEDVYILHETITDALGLSLLLISV